MTFGFDQSVNRFRQRRGVILRRQIDETARALGRKIEILDLGGRADYWQNVGLEGVERITLVNTATSEFGAATANRSNGVFEERIGDACHLADYPDSSVDLVHSNSVIEHVGTWTAMAAMASEARRVGRSGWIQTPSAAFPVEPHFHLPFIHWLSAPLRARALRLSPLAAYRQCSDAQRRDVVDSIQLLTRCDVAQLFPDCDIYVERLLLMPKSYVARWQLVTARA